MEPEIAPGGDCPIGPVPIAGHRDPRNLRANDGLAGNAGRNLVVVLVDDPHLVGPLVNAAAGPVVGEREARTGRTIHLGAAPGGRDPAAEALPEGLDLGDQRHDEHALERVPGIIGLRRLAIKQIGHRTQKERAGCAMAANGRPEPGEAEGVGKHGRRSGDRRRVDHRPLPRVQPPVISDQQKTSADIVDHRRHLFHLAIEIGTD